MAQSCGSVTARRPLSSKPACMTGRSPAGRTWRCEGSRMKALALGSIRGLSTAPPPSSTRRDIRVATPEAPARVQRDPLARSEVFRQAVGQQALGRGRQAEQAHKQGGAEAAAEAEAHGQGRCGVLRSGVNADHQGPSRAYDSAHINPAPTGFHP